MEHSITMSNEHICSHMFKQADNAIIEMKDPDHFRRKLDGPRYIAIVTENLVVPNTLINFALVIFFACGFGVAI